MSSDIFVYAVGPFKDLLHLGEFLEWHVFTQFGEVTCEILIILANFNLSWIYII